MILRNLRDEISVLPLSCRIRRRNGTMSSKGARMLVVSDSISPVAIVIVERNQIVFVSGKSHRWNTRSLWTEVCKINLADPTYVEQAINAVQKLAHEKIKKAIRWGTSREKIAAVRLRAKIKIDTSRNIPSREEGL